ncbi:MAG: mRNA-capping enzyme subunit beta [Pycnora praestabilis]|nr:MAG: mRNA-capping enzyme subunit beta [Pycnora praestabilis]
MDLRSIINADASSGVTQSSPRASYKQSSPLKQFSREYQGHYGGHVSPPPRQVNHQTRPPPPHAIQPTVQGDFRSPGGSLSYHSGQTAYQHTPTSSVTGGQYPFPQHPPQSPAHAQQSQSHSQRENYPSITTSGHTSQHLYNQPSPSAYTPSTSTPNSAQAFAQQLPSHSSQSSSTPTSAQSQSHYTHRDSPVSAGSFNYSQQPQHQSQHQQSQPSTPLGPPTTYHRPSAGAHREPQSPFSHHRNQSSGSYGGPPQINAISPIPTVSGTAGRSVNTQEYESFQSPVSERERNVREYLVDRERERSLSVSPKTRLPSQPVQESMELKHGSQEAWDGPVTPAKRKQFDENQFESYGQIDRNLSASRSNEKKFVDVTSHDLIMSATVSQSPSNSGSVVQNQLDCLVSTNGSDKEQRESGLTRVEQQQRIITVSPISYAGSAPSLPSKEASRSGSRGQPISTSSSMTPNTQEPEPHHVSQEHHTPIYHDHVTPQPKAPSLPPPPPPNPNAHQPVLKREFESAPGTATSSQQPPRKKPRHDEPPIFARKASRSTSSSPLMPNRRQPVPAINSSFKQEHRDGKSIPSQASIPAVVKEESNGDTPPALNSGVALPKAQPDLGDHGPLGPWEPSITNLTPHEELTRVISNFLFEQVVIRNDVGAGPAGGVPGQGAQLEIEAKIGQLIDRNTNDRLKLPVLTECVLDKDNPNLRVQFKSSMTESQHRNLNKFLNTTFLSSQAKPPPPSTSQSPQRELPLRPRIAMKYVHTRERDSFYDLPNSAFPLLPHSIRNQINQNHRIKVRVTKKQGTNETLAKIIKARVADLDVFSPMTNFDWRISVNLEMSYDGEVDSIPESNDRSRGADRNKDRMTYRHLAYQIDLTQVTPSDVSHAAPTALHKKANADQFQSASKTDKEHELEVEVSSAEVRKQGLLVQRGEVSQYEDLVRGFVDNVRTLARAGSQTTAEGR